MRRTYQGPFARASVVIRQALSRRHPRSSPRLERTRSPGTHAPHRPGATGRYRLQGAIGYRALQIEDAVDRALALADQRDGVAVDLDHGRGRSRGLLGVDHEIDVL